MSKLIPDGSSRAPSLKMIAGRDSTGKSLDELKGYSSTVVTQTFSENKPIVVTGTDEGRALGSESAVLHNLRSIMAVPLRVRDKVLGVVYLDSSLAKGLFTKPDLDLFAAISNQIAIAFETSRMASVEAERRALEKDLALVAAVQSLYLPKQNEFKNEKISLFGRYLPASTASGDWWWYKYSEKNKKLTVLVGDVTGHGAASAMLTASTAGTFQTMVRTGEDLPMEEILTNLNTDFIAISQDKYSMTMGAIELDTSSGKLRFTNAAGPPIFILNKESRARTIMAPGTPLGGDPFQLGIKEMDLRPGDRICIFTDGVSEMVLPNGSLLRNKRFLELLQRDQDLRLEEAGPRLLRELKILRGETPLQDDITLVLVDYCPQNEAPGLLSI
jgi:serine phosphatase RsbU (regulator of sigma subunit)